MSRHPRRPSKTEQEQTQALVAVLKPDLSSLPLWAIIQHKVGTCEPATCPVCHACESDNG